MGELRQELERLLTQREGVFLLEVAVTPRGWGVSHGGQFQVTLGAELSYSRRTEEGEVLERFPLESVTSRELNLYSDSSDTLNLLVNIGPLLQAILEKVREEGGSDEQRAGESGGPGLLPEVRGGSDKGGDGE